MKEMKQEVNANGANDIIRLYILQLAFVMEHYGMVGFVPDAEKLDLTLFLNTNLMLK